MQNPDSAAPKRQNNDDEPVHPLPCVLLRVPDEASGHPWVMVCIPHRPNRLPVQWRPPSGLQWRCADGKVEELAIGREHPDWLTAWNEIEGEGLLVCEMPDGERADFLSSMRPVGHWILKRTGSEGWFTD